MLDIRDTLLSTIRVLRTLSQTLFMSLLSMSVFYHFRSLFSWEEPNALEVPLADHALKSGVNIFRKILIIFPTVQLDVNEMHGEGELVRVEHPVLVHVRQLPDLPQHVVGQFGLDHFA